MPTDLAVLMPNDQLLSFFQPVVSIKRKRCVAAQSIVRIRELGNTEPQSPMGLFRHARESGLMLELDRRCRLLALANFASLRDRDPDLLLFMKFHGSVLDLDGVLGSGWIDDSVRELGLEPGGIVIEIDDSPVESIDALRTFAERCRSQGFLIAVDDPDDGNSNLKRLAVLKPDIIRLGRALVQGVDKDHVQGEIVRSLTHLAQRIGALVVADWLETEEEVSACMELGVDLFKGPFISPALPIERWSTRAALRAMEKAASLFQSSTALSEKAKEEEVLQHRAMQQAISLSLSRCQPEDFDYKLRGQTFKDGKVECMYVLDKAGWQITDSVTFFNLRSRTRGTLFKPAPKGTDHSYKDYFCGLMESGHVRHTTEPYISMASGNLCRTLSCRVKGANGKDYVLCIDVCVLGEAEADFAVKSGLLE